ncbi:MAG: hypothetical protein ACMUJM_13285 [bacterium]
MKPSKIRKRRKKKFRFKLIKVYLKIIIIYLKKFMVIVSLCAVAAIILVFLTSLLTDRVPNFLNGLENSIVNKVVTTIKEEKIDKETIENLKETYKLELKRNNEPDYPQAP